MISSFAVLVGQLLSVRGLIGLLRVPCSPYIRKKRGQTVLQEATEKRGRKTDPSKVVREQSAFPAAGRAGRVCLHTSTLLPSGKARVVQPCYLLQLSMIVIPASPSVPETGCFPGRERALLVGLFWYLYVLRYVSSFPFFFLGARNLILTTVYDSNTALCDLYRTGQEQI